MATVLLSEYLATSYEPDCDWIEGSLLKRNTGLTPHSLMMTELIVSLAAFEAADDLVVLPVIRVKVSDSRYRVADLCVIRRSLPMETIIETAPLLCVEIVAPEDPMSEMLERVSDYLAMGVGAVWLVDPWRRTVHSSDLRGVMLPVVDELLVPGTAIKVSLASLFSNLNKLEGVS